MNKRELLDRLGALRQFNNLLLNFDEEEHKYFVNGVNKPSVSRILDFLKSEEELEKFNSKEFQAFLKPYAEYGTFIHKETELIDRGYTFKPLEYDPKESEALTRYIHLTDKLKEQGYEIVAIELPLFSTKYNACGTIDRLFYNESTGHVLLADIKTGSTRETHWYQQLTYKDMLSEWGIYVDDIALLSLKLKNKIPLYSTLKEDKRDAIQEVWQQLEGLVNE